PEQREGPETLRPGPRSRSRPVYFFARFAFLARAADPYRSLKHFPHRASCLLMKLGARSFFCFSSVAPNRSRGWRRRLTLPRAVAPHLTRLIVPIGPVEFLRYKVIETPLTGPRSGAQR